MHPRSRHWRMIDFIITRCREMMDIHSTRVMRGHNCWANHEKLRSKVAFRIRQNTTGKGQVSRQRKLNTRRGIGSFAAGRIQHSQYISWQASQKTPGLVRPQRPGATGLYEEKRTSSPKNVANQEH